MDGENNNVNNNNNSNPNALNATGQDNAGQTSNNGIDYNKIQEIIDGRNAKTEESVLKSYFQKQGLSADEMESAINSFKSQKANQAKQQDQINIDLQEENTTLKSEISKMNVEKAAIQSALELGIDVKTVPYLIKMADLSGAINEKGEILNDAITTALNKVLEDLPQLKPQSQNKGFQKIGADNNNGNQSNIDAQLDAIFGM